jgi:hypothetical protein
MLIEQALYGKLNFLAAAKAVAAEAKLVAAFKAASPAARAAAGVRIGPAVLWDAMVEPAISA